MHQVKDSVFCLLLLVLLSVKKVFEGKGLSFSDNKNVNALFNETMKLHLIWEKIS